MQQNMITIRNLSKEFKGQSVLKNITMEIPKNCVYGLLGANGAGKSTLLKTITGKKKAGAFSLGMKQRLGIGLALLNDPKLLVLDEPVNGLDPLGIQELRALIRSFPQKGITVIISSHILSEIQQTADYIGIIAKGTVGFEGKLQEQQDLEALFMKVVAKGGNES